MSASPPLILCLTNDVHSHMATSASLFDELAARRARGELIVDSGDLLEGTALYHYGEGALELELLERLYDYACPGNHGFGAMVAHTFKRCKILMLNVLTASDHRPRFTPWAMIEHGDRRVAITAVMSPEVFDTIPIQERRGLRCAPLRASLFSLIEELKGQADELIIMSHCGIAADLIMFQDLPSTRLVLSAHCHSATYERRSPRGSLTLIKAREHGEGYVRIAYESDHIRSTHHLFAPSRARFTAAALEPLNRHLDDYWRHIDREIGRFTQSSSDRDTLTTMLVRSLQLVHPERLCVINTTCLRQRLDPGVVTFGKLMEVFPFGNSLVVGQLTISQLNSKLNALSDELRAQLCFGRELDEQHEQLITLCTTSYLWRNIFSSAEVQAAQDLGLLRDRFVDSCLEPL